LGFPELTGINKIAAPLAPMIAKFFPALPFSAKLQPDSLSHDEKYLSERADDPLIFDVATPQWLVSCTKLIDEVQAQAKIYNDAPPILCLLAGDERITNLTAARKFAFNGLSSIKHKVVEFPDQRHELEKEPAVRARVVKESIAWMLSHN
jgi:acylglycerol lipase